MATQIAVQAGEFAPNAKGIKINTIPVPTPGAGEVLVKFTLRPVNPADVFSTMGVYPGWTPSALPATLGLEGTAVVEALGPNTSGALKVGQRVCAAPWPAVKEGNGTWRQFAAVPEEALVPVPDDVSDEAAAMAVINPITVLGMFEEAKIPAGEYVLVTAAGSALGRMCASYAKAHGIKTVGTVRREAQKAELLAEGYDAILVDGAEDIPAGVKALTGGKGAYAAFECVAGSLTGKVSASLRNGGTMYVYGAMTGVAFDSSVVDLIFRGVTITGFWVEPYLKNKDYAGRRAVLEAVWKQYQTGVFKPFAGIKYPLEKASEAILESMKEARGAKVLLQG